MKLKVFFLLSLIIMFSDVHCREIDQKKTTSNIFKLSVMTVLPVFALSLKSVMPHYGREIVISVAIAEIPAIIGWPVFLREIRRSLKER